MSFGQGWFPTFPPTVRWCAAWNRRTAAVESGPNTPSVVRPAWTRWLSRYWMSTTRAPLLPWTVSGHESASGSAGTAGVATTTWAAGAAGVAGAAIAAPEVIEAVVAAGKGAALSTTDLRPEIHMYAPLIEYCAGCYPHALAITAWW